MEIGVPTREAYGELQTAYDHFNRTLFNNELPPCLITLQREKRAYGYFLRDRFVSTTGAKTDEIAMNPAYFAVVPVTEVLQTLVHEMVHLWQAHYGTPGRRGYHNRQWADRMEAVGLMPSHTGKPGGRPVGEKMADYPMPGGPFEAAATALLATDFTITWRDRFPARERLEQLLTGADTPTGAVEATPAAALEALGIDVAAVTARDNKSNRCKYTCQSCNLNAWAKPNASLVCGECYEAMIDLEALTEETERT